MDLVGLFGPSQIPGLDVIGYIAAGPDGGLYVVSAGSSEVIVLDAWNVVGRWGKAGTKLGEFGFLRDPDDPESALGGVAVAPDGTVFVVEAGNKRVQRFSADGTPQLAWGKRGNGDGEFLDPIGIALSASGQVYVVDDERDDIQVFTPDGAYVRTLGRHGSDLGEMSFTGNIRFTADGSLVNADFGNARVQAWDEHDGWQWSTGSEGLQAGQFHEPQDVAFGPDGTMYVVDDGRVQAFDSELNVIGVWQGPATAEHLATIAFYNGNLWVGAPYVDRLYVLSVHPG